MAIHPSETDIDNLWKAIGILGLLAPLVGTFVKLKVKQIEKALRDLGTIADHNHKRLNELENGELTRRIKAVLATRREEMRVSDAKLPVATRRMIVGKRQGLQEHKEEQDHE